MYGKKNILLDENVDVGLWLDGNLLTVNTVMRC